jgi:hypothetical protein
MLLMLFELRLKTDFNYHPTRKLTTADNKATRLMIITIRVAVTLLADNIYV